MGIEALSRGGQLAVFIEQNRQAIKVIKDNLQTTGLAAQAEIYPLDVERGLKILARQDRQFDLIFLGAPYDSPALERALIVLGGGQYLKTMGLVIAEHRKQRQIPAEFGQLLFSREERYGETVLTFYEKSNLSRKF